MSACIIFLYECPYDSIKHSSLNQLYASHREIVSGTTYIGKTGLRETITYVTKVTTSMTEDIILVIGDAS